MSLLNSFAETTSGEVNLATETLLLVITEPVLQKWRTKTLSAQGVTHTTVQEQHT